jgi:hypothetical protein
MRVRVPRPQLPLLARDPERRARVRFDCPHAHHMVEVPVRRQYRRHGRVAQRVQSLQNALRLQSGVNHGGLARRKALHQVAVRLQHAQRQFLDVYHQGM